MGLQGLAALVLVVPALTGCGGISKEVSHPFQADTVLDRTAWTGNGNSVTTTNGVAVVSLLPAGTAAPVGVTDGGNVPRNALLDAEIQVTNTTSAAIPITLFHVEGDIDPVLSPCSADPVDVSALAAGACLQFNIRLLTDQAGAHTGQIQLLPVLDYTIKGNVQ